jgi:hypothetical protein
MLLDLGRMAGVGVAVQGRLVVARCGCFDPSAIGFAHPRFPAARYPLSCSPGAYRTSWRVFKPLFFQVRIAVLRSVMVSGACFTLKGQIRQIPNLL